MSDFLSPLAFINCQFLDLEKRILMMAQEGNESFPGTKKFLVGEKLCRSIIQEYKNLRSRNCASCINFAFFKKKNLHRLLDDTEKTLKLLEIA